MRRMAVIPPLRIVTKSRTLKGLLVVVTAALVLVTVDMTGKSVSQPSGQPGERMPLKTGPLFSSWFAAQQLAFVACWPYFYYMLSIIAKNG